jgi:hypothetical protein
VLDLLGSQMHNLTQRLFALTKVAQFWNAAPFGICEPLIKGILLPRSEHYPEPLDQWVGRCCIRAERTEQLTFRLLFFRKFVSSAQQQPRGFSCR